MTPSNPIRNFIVGKNVFIEDSAEFKRVLLVGQLSILVVIASILFLILGGLLQNFSGYPLFFTTIAAAVLAFYLNRFEHYKFAKYALLISGNFIIALFVLKDPIESGSNFYFMACALGAVAFFSFKEKTHWVFFLSLTFILFFYTQYQTHYGSIKQPFSVELNQLYYAINFLASAIVCILMVYFLIRTAHSIEKDLFENQKLLKNSEERFRLAMYGINAGLWDWPDMSKSAFWWSPKCYDLLGYKYDEIPAHKTSFWNLLIHNDDSEMLNAALLNHIRKRQAFNLEIRLKTKTKGYQWFICSGQAQWDTNGKPLRMVGSILNIDDIKKKEQKIIDQNRQLEKANKELDRFVYSASHDLRAPLTSILGLINLSATEKNPEELQRMLELMRGRVSNLNQFINEIIDYSKNTRVEVKRDFINARDFMKQVVENAKYRDGIENIAVNIEIEENLLMVSDENRLKVVFNNLIDNAIKYHDRSKPSRFINIEAKKSMDSIYFYVKDNGRGIAEDLQPKIFDMFYRASEDSKGSGLGLYIVKETIEKLGGEISVSSEKYQGTIFTVQLPHLSEIEEVIN